MLTLHSGPTSNQNSTSVTVLYGLRWQLSLFNYLMASPPLRIAVWNGGNNLPFLNIYTTLVAFRALRNSLWRRRHWVTAKFLRHKRGGLKNLTQLYQTDTSQDRWWFRIRLVGQKEFVNVFCEFLSGLVTSRSPKYTITKSSPRVTWSIKRWNVCPEFRRPNGVLVKLNRPKGVVTAVLSISDGSTGI